MQQTSDGQVVLVHDRDLRRVTGDPHNVADIDLAELGRLRLRLNGQATDQHVPALAEFLEACDSHIRLNVEMKDFGRSQSLGTAVVDVLHTHGFIDRTGASSFQMAPLLQAKHDAPKLPIGIIVSAAKGAIHCLLYWFWLASCSLGRRHDDADRQLRGVVLRLQ